MNTLVMKLLKNVYNANKLESRFHHLRRLQISNLWRNCKPISEYGSVPSNFLRKKIDKDGNTVEADEEEASLGRREKGAGPGRSWRPRPETIPYEASRALSIQERCRGSFSTVSKPFFKGKQSFCRILQDPQNLRTFAPLQIQIFRLPILNFALWIRWIFRVLPPKDEFSLKSVICSSIFSSNCGGIAETSN